MQQFAALEQYAVYNLLSKSRFVCHCCLRKTLIVNEQSIQPDRDSLRTLPCEPCQHKPCALCHFNPKILRKVASYQWQPVAPESDERPLFVHVCCGCGEALRVGAIIQSHGSSSALQKPVYVDFRRSKCHKCRHRCCEQCACLIEMKTGVAQPPKRSVSTRSKASTVRSVRRDSDAGELLERSTSMLQRVSSVASRASSTASKIASALSAPFKLRPTSAEQQHDEDQLPLITAPEHGNCKVPNCTLCHALKAHRSQPASPPTDAPETEAPNSNVYEHLERGNATKNILSRETTPGGESQSVEDPDGFVMPPGSEYLPDHLRTMEDTVRNWVDELDLSDPFEDPNEPLEEESVTEPTDPTEPPEINRLRLDVELATSESSETSSKKSIEDRPPTQRTRQRMYTKEHLAHKRHAEEVRDASSGDSRHLMEE